MSPTMLFVFILLTCAGAFFLGKRRAFSVSEGAGGALRLHSRPAYYGMLAALWCSIPALLIYGCWLAFEDKIITSLVVADLPEQMRNLPENHLNLMVNDIKNLVNGNIVSGQVDPAMRAAAEHYTRCSSF